MENQTTKFDPRGRTLNVTSIGTYGTLVKRYDLYEAMCKGIPADHHLESVRSNEYWLIKSKIEE